MWILTTIGFFSVVQHMHDSTTLVVRARARADLEVFRTDIHPHPEIVRTPENDYPYRCFVNRLDFALWLTRHAMDEINYSNFKNAVSDTQGFARASTYHDVWHKLREVEDAGAREPRRAPRRRARGK